MTTLLGLMPLLISGLGWSLGPGAAFAGSWPMLGVAIVFTLGRQGFTGWWLARRGDGFPPHGPLRAALPFCGWAPAFIGDIISPTATTFAPPGNPLASSLFRHDKIAA